MVTEYCNDTAVALTRGDAFTAKEVVRVLWSFIRARNLTRSLVVPPTVLHLMCQNSANWYESLASLHALLTSGRISSVEPAHHHMLPFMRIEKP